MAVAEDPLVALPPPEVPLAAAPLVRVIAQVRFPLAVAVEQRELISAFHRDLRARYPVLRQESTQGGVLVGPQGMVPSPAQVTWRLADVEAHWRISLTAEFVALETTRYTSRADFLARLREVLDAVARHVEPTLVDRVGLRYIDRITGDALQDVARLVRPEVCGLSGSSAAARLIHALSEAVFALDSDRLAARWGQLPAGATVDPGALEPLSERSWILDLDMYSTEPYPFDAERVVSEAGRYAERLYTFFRWAVTDEFLRRFGGQS